MDNFDREILSELQNDFPISPKPYNIIADKLGMSIDELWGRITKMMDSGVIRRMGVSLDSRKLGYSSTLAAVRVAPNLIEHAAAVISQFTEVTHSYLRDDLYNIWFTIIANNEDRINEILDQICVSLSLDNSDVLNLPVKQSFKLDARFEAMDKEKKP